MRFGLIDAPNVLMRCVSVLEREYELAREAHQAALERGETPRGPAPTAPEERPEDAGRMALKMAERWVQERGLTHVIACFDTPEAPTWRRVEYPEYKGNRTRDTRIFQRPGRALFGAAGLHTVAVDGQEADDAIAALSARLAGRAEVHVLSGDNDLLVLTALTGVQVWQFGRQPAEPRHVARSAAWVCEKYGLAEPGQLTLYKTLVGEKGDNVPGVPRIGPVKAKKLIADWGTLDRMCKVGAIPEAQQAWARQAERLLALRYDAPVPAIRPSECAVPVGTRQTAMAAPPDLPVAPLEPPPDLESPVTASAAPRALR